MPKEPILTYGNTTPEMPQWYYDMKAFSDRKGAEVGIHSRVALFKKIADFWLPGHFEYHAWTDRMLRTLCSGDWTIMAGCAGSAKTFNVTSFATFWWLCAPRESSVTFVSTTFKSVRQRNWAEISKIHSKLEEQRPGEWGNFVDSRGLWQWKKGDDKHVICCRAVEEGSIVKVADNIKGIHTKRQMVIIEEATSVPAAIYDACFNLYSYPEEFILIINGNPRSKLDQMGLIMTPAAGWLSVTPDTEQWQTGPQINGKPATVMRFDAEKSPNILAGKVVSKHLPTAEKVRIAKANGDTPLYWSNFRGFPPPDGLDKTVFSETALTAHDGMGKHIFTGQQFEIIGAFDHARDGGDNPTLRFAKLGKLDNGKIGIQAFPPIVIPINAASTNPIDFQIAEQLRRQCETFKVDEIAYPCRPENLAIDEGGDGAGLCDIVNRLWSFGIIRIQFNSAASTDSCSLEDNRPANEVYWNKRAEMYFRSRDALNHEQLKGIDPDTAKEMCSIRFDDSRRKILIESKKDYRTRNNGRSPDNTDSLIMLLEVARRRGFHLTPVGETANRVSSHDDFVKQASRVYEEVEYATEELE